MKIVVIGGSGLIGTKLVSNLRQQGHEVVAASPISGVNTLTGEGLAEALAGAQVVVDVANSPSFEDQAVLEFFETVGPQPSRRRSGRWRGASRCAVGGRHRPPSGQRLLAREVGPGEADQGLQDPLHDRPRSTQFFEFVGGIAQSATDGQTVRLPPALMQPIASDDVAAALADAHLARRSTARSRSPVPSGYLSTSSPGVT